MHIIIGDEAAQSLRENYTVLELETFDGKDQKVTAYCVVPEIPIMELPLLEHHKQLHADFIREYNDRNYKYCIDAVEHLRGKFNGDLDSFYDIIVEKINSLNLD